MKITKQSKIYWPKASWLDRSYLDYAPEELKKRGWKIIHEPLEMVDNNKIKIPQDVDLIFCHGPSVSRFFLSKYQRGKPSPPQVHQVWDLPIHRRWDTYSWNFTVFEMDSIKQDKHKVTTLSHTTSKQLKEIFDIDSTPVLQYFNNKAVEKAEKYVSALNHVIMPCHHRDNKNFFYAVQALSMLDFPIKLVLTGKPNDFTNHLFYTARKLDVDFTWIEDADYDTVLGLIKSAKALIYPSIHEGFSLPPKEAIWAKVPTLVSDIPVHREIHGDDIGYFNIADPSSLANRLTSLVTEGKMTYDKNRAIKKIKPFTMDQQIDNFEKYLHYLEV